MLKMNIPEDTGVQIFSHPGGQKCKMHVQKQYETERKMSVLAVKSNFGHR